MIGRQELRKNHEKKQIKSPRNMGLCKKTEPMIGVPERDQGNGIKFETYFRISSRRTFLT